jgi:hypothetical protein
MGRECPIDVDSFGAELSHFAGDAPSARDGTKLDPEDTSPLVCFIGKQQWRVLVKNSHEFLQRRAIDVASAGRCAGKELGVRERHSHPCDGLRRTPSLNSLAAAAALPSGNEFVIGQNSQPSTAERVQFHGPMTEGEDLS